MKKSKIYHKLQIMVLADANAGTYENAEESLEILRELMGQEVLAKYAEEQPEKEAAMWLPGADDGFDWVKCSVCGEETELPDDYCSYCGAKMKNGGAEAKEAHRKACFEKSLQAAVKEE